MLWNLFVAIGVAWIFCSLFFLVLVGLEFKNLRLRKITRREALMSTLLIVASMPILCIHGASVLSENLRKNTKLQEWLDEPLFSEKKKVTNVPANR